MRNECLMAIKQTRLLNFTHKKPLCYRERTNRLLLIRLRHLEQITTCLIKIIMKKACFVNRLYSYLDKFLHLPIPIVMLELPLG
nr:MAG TPA: hypothetical protein [Caudoviricetes sp.]